MRFGPGLLHFLSLGRRVFIVAAEDPDLRVSCKLHVGVFSGKIGVGGGASSDHGRDPSGVDGGVEGAEGS